MSEATNNSLAIDPNNRQAGDQNAFVPSAATQVQSKNIINATCRTTTSFLSG